jgi:hypothetical protein
MKDPDAQDLSLVYALVTFLVGIIVGRKLPRERD